MQRYANDLEPSGYEWDLKFHYKSGRYTARDHARFHTVSTYVLGIFRIQEVNEWSLRMIMITRLQTPNIDVVHNK